MISAKVKYIICVSEVVLLMWKRKCFLNGEEYSVCFEGEVLFIRER